MLGKQNQIITNYTDYCHAWETKGKQKAIQKCFHMHPRHVFMLF